MVFFQTPQDIPLGQRAHIFALAVQHRNGGVAVIFPLFQRLPEGEVIVNVHQILLWGKKKENVHANNSYRIFYRQCPLERPARVISCAVRPAYSGKYHGKRGLTAPFPFHLYFSTFS